jgi:phosphoglycerate dehydrogenase-like enzyme
MMVKMPSAVHLGWSSLLSPHVSGMDRMAERLVTERCVSNILEYLGGRPQAIVPYVVNPQVLAG